jgi:murein L,D-transpeptidase YafK
MGVFMRIPLVARAAVVAAAAALVLAGCKDVDLTAKHMQPLSRATKQLIAQKGMTEGAPIFIRIFKEESELEIWKQEQASGRYALLKTYDICAWSGQLGPKLKEGDKQAPEGFYTVTPAQMNPNSSYYLSFNLGFPNSFDRAHGRTGAHLMVHGACSSAGCYAMEDEQIAEIYALGRDAFIGGQRAFQVQAFPFRMTPENMARHRDNPNMAFWRMLKEGHDHFEVTRVPPKVEVCDGRYVFNAEPKDGRRFNATAACPELSVPEAIRIAVEEKTARDEAKFALIASKLDGEAATAVAAAESGPMTPIPASMAAQAPAVASATPMSVRQAAQAAPAPQPADGPDGVVASAYAPDEARARDRSFVGRLLKNLW